MWNSDTLRRPCNPSEVLPHKRVQLIKIMVQLQLCSKVSTEYVRNYTLFILDILRSYFTLECYICIIFVIIVFTIQFAQKIITLLSMFSVFLVHHCNNKINIFQIFLLIRLDIDTNVLILILIHKLLISFGFRFIWESLRVESYADEEVSNASQLITTKTESKNGPSFRHLMLC